MRHKVKIYIVSFSAAFASFLIYLPALNNNFVTWDDNEYVYENQNITSLNADFFKWAFLKFNSSNWHPLTWVSHAVDYSIWGLNPFGHHLTSVVLHGINVFLVTLLIARLLEVFRKSAVSADRLSDGNIMIAGAVAGLMFGLHPIHVESVAWISERKDVLSAFFFLLSLLSYVYYADDAVERKPSGLGLIHSKYYLFALVFFILALLSKPMAVTLPVVLLIIDWYPFRRLAAVRDIKTVLFEKIPFFSLSASSALITIFAQKSAVIKVATLPVSVRTGNGINSIWSYIQNMLLPGDLIPFYPHSVNFNFFSYKFIFSLIFFSGVTLIFLFLARKQKIWLSIWGYYLITLFPVLGIIQVGSQAMADRYMYLPSIGPFFLVGLGAVLAVEYFKRQKDMLRLFSLFTALIIPASLMYATLGQIDKWKDGVSLWGYEIGVLLKKSDRNYKTLAMAYLNRGQAYFMQKSYEKAIQDFTKAVEFNPKCADCYNNRGVAYLKTGGLERALRDYDYGIFLEPGSYAAYVNRGIIYSRLERYADALTDYNKSIELKPDNPEIFYNRGLTYARLGRLQEAVGDYTTAINTSPHPDYYYSRGTALKKLGYEKEALADLMLAGK